MFRTVLYVAAALLIFGIVSPSAVADSAFRPEEAKDDATCNDSYNKEAIAACSRLISAHPNVASYYYHRGNAYFHSDRNQAIADFSEMIRLDPKDPHGYTARADIYFWKGDYDRAIVDYGMAITLAPNDKLFPNDPYYTYLDRARAYAGKGDYERAIADFDQAIRRRPNDTLGHTVRGDFYRLKGEHGRAIADYDQAIGVQPDWAHLYVGRGEAYHQEGDDDRAIADYDQAIRIHPDDVEPYVDRGEAYHQKGDDDQAIADADHAIKLLEPLITRSSDARLLYSRGRAYRLKREYNNAIADFDQAILLNPRYNALYDARGEALFDKGEYDLATADFDQALKISPLFAQARQHRERTLAALVTRPTPPKPVAAAPLPAPSHQAALPESRQPPALAERRVALVIGNSGYTSSLVQALPNPRRDAKLVADALRQAGFEVMELEDLDRTGMAKALGTFRAKAASADWALIYFAGHGIEINRVNYLIPVDAKLTDSGDVELETVSYEAMLNAIGGAMALRIIILDACRNNPFKAQMHQTVALRSSLDRGLAPPPEAKPGTLVVYSAKEGETAIDGDGVNSPFALAFVARLKKPGREVQRMFDDVRDDVLEATSNRQQPYKYGSLTGKRDFFFVAGK